jgi:Ca-activated chloride channel family protein
VRRVSTLVALAVVLVLLASACSYDEQDPTVVRLTDPGKCVPVDVAAAPETASLLSDAASRFNGSAAARLADGGCAFARIETVDPPVALRELLAKWPDSARLGPPPAAWVPGSTMWGELLNARLVEQGRRPLAPNGTSIARSPLVVAMPAPMARALDSPRRAITWSDLEQLAANPRGWAAHGHPEWGPFRLGKGNPNFSTTGLDQTIALDAAPASTSGTRALEQSVIYYGDTTQVYFDNWKRLAAKSTASALTYLSAVITDERSVVAYNTGAGPGATTFDGGSTRPNLPLVAVSPKDATIESDQPMIALDAPWASPAARAGVRLFTKFVLQPATQKKIAAAGFRPARGAVNTKVLDARNGVDPHAHGTSVAPASPLAIEQALAHWQANRHRARVLVLFDVSDSMGDPADPAFPHGPTKLALARVAMSVAVDQLAPDDEIGLRIFSTKLDGDHNWSDVVPIGPLATRRHTLDTTIAALEPHQGSPLYAATRDAYDDIARHRDPRRIDGVVVLTDGYNEDDHDTNLTALLAHLAANTRVRVFTIAYSNDADQATLRKIAQATNAGTYDARDTHDLADVLPRALASF